MLATNLSWSFLSTGQLPYYRKLKFSTESSSGHLASPSLGSTSQYTSQIGRFDLTRGLVEGVQWYNHIKWWRPGELSVIFMVFHPRPPFNAVLPQQFLDSIVEFVK